jgi:radical SAM superfamily enzyme YgiQ (UPF0313 family)
MNSRPRPKILVVFPSYFHGVVAAGQDEVKSSPLLLASYLARRFEVEYADFELSIGCPTSAIQIKRFERRAREFLQARQPDIIAISCWTSLSYRSSMSVARLAREVHRDALIVTGGYHPTARPNDFITADSTIDYVIRGEGELALTEIANSLRTAGRPASTQVVDSASLQPSHFVPVDWGMADELLSTHYPDGVGTLCVYLSRGCPFECAFCIESLKDRCWRPWPVEHAVEQLHNAATRHAVRAIAIGDACFGVKRSWRRQVFQQLVEMKPDYWILLETRPEFLDDEDVKLLSKLKVQVQFGIESCSSQMLRTMNKTKHPEKFLERFRRLSHALSDHSVVHGANLIFNHPGETQQTLGETFEFVDRELDRSETALMWACHGYLHFPGSAVDQNRTHYEEQYGTVFEQPLWWLEEGDPFREGRRVVPSAELSGERIELWRRMFNERSQRLKDCLSDAAFQLAAETYFSDWRTDPRYRGV